MKVEKFNKRDIRFAPWTALCVLSLLAAMVFAVPSVVFAQTVEISQDCGTALVGTDHTIRVKVTDDSGVPPFGFWFGRYIPGPTSGIFFTSPGGEPLVPDENGEFVYTYTSTDVGTDQIVIIDQTWIVEFAIFNTIWTADKTDLCSQSKSPGVTVGGRLTLNPKKRGALKIAVCAADGLEVSNVDPKTVRLAGVAPWHWKQKDSRLCPGGKDAVVDLVLKFKNREVVEALEESKVELADVDWVDLVLSGSLKDGTAFDGVWKAEIKKKGKRHGKKNHHQKNHKER